MDGTRGESEARFAAYVDSLADALGHAADSDEAARLKRDDCAQGFLDDAAPFNEMIAPGGPRVLAE